MLIPERSSKSTAFIVLSCVLHGALFIAIGFYTTDWLQMDQPGHRDTYELELESSLGEQTEIETKANVEVKAPEINEPDTNSQASVPAQPEQPIAEKEVSLPEKVIEPKLAETPKITEKPIVKEKVVAQPKPEESLPEIKKQASTLPAEPIKKTPSYKEMAVRLKKLDQTKSLADEAPVQTNAAKIGEELEPAALPEDLSLKSAEEIEDFSEKTESLASAKAAPTPTPYAPSESFSSRPESLSRNEALGAQERIRPTSMQAPGVPTGVQDYRNLVQQPGNTIPSYDREDRLKGRQGEVSFLAYVNADGTLADFRMKKSTGHRSLDLKSLRTIKLWRFKPGQEGWVEIPLLWSLTGEAIEVGSPLRR